MRAQYGLESPVIYPPIHLERYRTVRRSPGFITFFNPVAKKGVDLVLDVAARLRHRRFRSWKGTGCAVLPMRISLPPRRVTPSRHLLPKHSGLAPGVRQDCAAARPVPSTTEAFGRVVVEAQASGIPCVARDCRGAR